VSCGRRHSTGFDGFAFVANEEGQAIAAVDLTAFAVVRHVRLDANPSAVIAHPRSGVVHALTPSTGAVHDIDPDRLSVVRKRHAGGQALAFAIPWETPERLFVLYREPRRLVMFEQEKAAAEWEAALPAEAASFDVSMDGRTSAVGFGSTGKIAFVDTASRKVDVVDAGTETGLVRFRSDGRALLVADVRERRLLIYDVATRKLVVRLPLAVRPDEFCVGGGGGQLFITGEGMDAVVVAYPYETQVHETILAGRQPGAMAASSGRPPYLFIANPTSGDVTIMNVATRKVVAVASVGAEPGFITITPDNQYALVLNRKSGDMGVLRIHDKLASRQKSAGLFTMIPVGSRPVSAAIRHV
jgi:YVTN family beta-propeller protein